MASFKSTNARTCGRVGTDDDDERHAKKSRPTINATSPTICIRPASRRVQAPAPVVDRRREAATIAYIKAQAKERKDKLLVSSEQPHVRLRADALRSLTVPLSEDGPERKILAVVLDAYIELLRRRGRQGGAGHITRNGRRVLLLGVEEQDWLQYLGTPPRTAEHRLTEQDAAEMAATAGRYLENDLVFFLVNHREHFFAAALDFRRGEYQVLDSGNYARRNGARFYEEATSRIRRGVARCMKEAGRAHDAAGWRLRRAAGLPEQTDESSCGLFALRWMELWDGEELARSFTMDDVHAFRTRLAEELVFSEMNQMQDVKDEIKSMMTQMRSN
jgi:hypothetical protein